MKTQIRVAITSIISVLASLPALAGSNYNFDISHPNYSDSSSVCDVGIMNSNFSSNNGINSISYVQNGVASSVSSSATNANFSSAYVLNSLTQVGNFDQWNAANVLENISFNLGSDTLGAQFYFDICYQWNRTSPTDTFVYYNTLNMSALPAITDTDQSYFTSCNFFDSAGTLLPVSIPSTDSSIAVLTVAIPSKTSIMKCHITTTYVEKNAGSVRGISHIIDTKNSTPTKTLPLSISGKFTTTVTP